MTMIGAGKRDRRIALRRQMDGTNSMGEPVGAWLTVDEVWASLRPQTGRELVGAGQVEDGVAYTTFRILWRADVQLAWVIVYAGQIFDLKSIVEVGRREELEILGQARAA